MDGAALQPHLQDSVSRLLQSMDIPGPPDAYVRTLARNIEPHNTISKVRSMSTRNKLRRRVLREDQEAYDKVLADLDASKTEHAERFLYLASLVLEDKALTALLSTSMGAGATRYYPRSRQAGPVRGRKIVGVQQPQLKPQRRQSQRQQQPQEQQPQLQQQQKQHRRPVSRGSSSRFSNAGGAGAAADPRAPATVSSSSSSSSISTGNASGQPRAATLGLSTSSANSNNAGAPARRRAGSKAEAPASSSSSSSSRSSNRGSSSAPLVQRGRVARMGPRQDDLVDLCFGTKVALRAHNTRFAHVGDNGDFLADSLTAQPFVVTNAKHLRDRGPIRLQDTVCLRSGEGTFVSAESDGTASGNRTEADTRARWTVVSARVLDGTDKDAVGAVKTYDSVALQSCFGTYLTVEEDGTVNANGTHVRLAQAFTIAHAALPFVPDWVRVRPDALRQSSQMHSEATMRQQSLVAVFNSFPSEVQEQLLLEDLLFAMAGVQGKWVWAREDESGERVFGLRASITDSSLRSLMDRLLPVCNYHAYVARFVEVHSRFEFGLVNHAFAAAMRAMLKEYLILIAQLEHQFRRRDLTLLRAWYYVQPSLHSMERLARICRCAQHNKGGALLNVLHKAVAQEGDEQTRALYTHLLSAASAPYFEMLQEWIYQGVIKDKDPHGEFQVKSKEELTKENLRHDFYDTYWDERYTVRPEQLPVFLESISDKILTTGKYLNVIRECRREIKVPFAPVRMTYTDNVREYAAVVEQAYSFASRELLRLLMHEENLVGRLRSIKRYFMLDQGDWYVHLMDIAGEELGKSVADINPNKLRSLLELAQRTSGANLDPFKDDLSCYLQPYTLIQKLDAIHSTSDANARLPKGHSLSSALNSGIDNPAAAPASGSALKGLEAFTLAYRVRWPLSLIVSKKTLTKYQLIFRHLFFCKHVEMRLGETWRNHQQLKELELGPSFSRSFSLRHRMLHFVQNFTYYLMVEVVEPNWHELEAKLGRVATVDEVLRFHNQFLDQCLKECLLTNQQLLKLLTKLLSTCLLFADNIERFTQSVKVQDSDLNDSSSKRPMSVEVRRQTRIRVESHHIAMVVAQKNYIIMIDRFVALFDDKLGQFIAHLRDKSSLHYDHHLANLYTRLDYNGFYSSEANAGGAH